MKRKREKHGMYDTKIYQVWVGIKTRCFNSNDHNYLRYGARGIGMCDEWKNSFSAFYRDMGDQPEDMSIEREDNQGDYTPENCKWVTWKEQCNNRRTNVLLTYKGKTMNVLQWGKLMNYNPKNIYQRLSRGWSTERALCTR